LRLLESPHELHEVTNHTAYGHRSGCVSTITVHHDTSCKALLQALNVQKGSRRIHQTTDAAQMPHHPPAEGLAELTTCQAQQVKENRHETQPGGSLPAHWVNRVCFATESSRTACQTSLNQHSSALVAAAVLLLLLAACLLLVQPLAALPAAAAVPGCCCMRQPVAAAAVPCWKSLAASVPPDGTRGACSRTVIEVLVRQHVGYCNALAGCAEGGAVALAALLGTVQVR
jgi:hypothetical protein